MRNKLVDNRYRVIARIGQGAMGKVFQAEHVYTKQPVALKIIHPQYQQDEQYRVRFLREIELACRVRHPHAVQILDAGEAESNMLYMAMEYLDGQTLSNLLKQSPQGLELDVALNIAHQIGLALGAIHGAGLVHRDLKPDNIMILSDDDPFSKECMVKILDFGIARDLDALNSLTGKMMIGTPKFMSPEQTRGEKLTQQSDIYNLGLILYAMLTGKEPFSSDSPVGYVFHHNMTQPAPVSSLRSDVPPHIEWAIQKALSKDPELRFETAAAFIATLTVGRSRKKTARVNRGPEMPVHTIETPRPAGVWKKVMIGGISIVALAFAGMSMLTRSNNAPAYADALPFADSTYMEDAPGLVNVPSLAALPIDSMFPVIITPNWDSLNDLLSMTQDSATQYSTSTGLAIAESTATKEVSDNSPSDKASSDQIQSDVTGGDQVKEEIDPNILFYQKLGKEPIRSPLRDGGLESATADLDENKSIEENSNIVRLREKQRIAEEAEAKARNKAKQSAAKNAGSNALPVVKGGVERLSARLNYPMEAAIEKVSGTVGIKLLIDEKGVLQEAQIFQSVGYGCDEEVLRVLQEAEFEPARLNNKPIKAWLNLQFSFKLVR